MHHLAAADRLLHHLPIHHASDANLGAQLPELVMEEPGRMIEHAHAMAAFEKSPGEVAAGKAGASSHQNLHESALRQPRLWINP